MEEYTNLRFLVQNSLFFSSLLLILWVAYFHFSQSERENEIEESYELRFYRTRPLDLQSINGAQVCFISNLSQLGSIEIFVFLLVWLFFISFIFHYKLEEIFFVFMQQLVSDLFIQAIVEFQGNST